MLVYRLRRGELEVLLGHPGGPFWARKDAGAWTLFKGEIAPHEEPITTARRELEEETGIVAETDLVPLGEIVQKSGKHVLAFALGQNFDPSVLRSNTCTVEWPPRSGKQIEIPEIDRAAWFTLEEAHAKVNPGQRPLLDRLKALLEPAAPQPIPIDDELDLHTFSPNQIKDVVTEYLHACRERGLREVRIVHGKGTGTLRMTVHALLERHPDVVRFGLAPDHRGGWGATVVELRG